MDRLTENRIKYIIYKYYLMVILINVDIVISIDRWQQSVKRERGSASVGYFKLAALPTLSYY